MYRNWKMKMIHVLFLTGLINFLSAQNIHEGLLAHWGFNNDNNSKILDESGNGIHGTAYEISHVKGINGQAIQFNSTQDAVFFPEKDHIPPEPVSDLSVGTISLWFNFQNVGGNILPLLYFGEKSEDAPHKSLILEIGHGANGGDPDNRRLYFTIVNQRFCFDSRENLSPNRWYHFVAVVDSNKNTGFLNGAELDNRKYNLGSDSTYSDFFADVPTNEVLSLGYGRFGQDDRFFHYKGLMDEVRIYNRPLSSQEIELLWNEGKRMAGVPDYKDVHYGPWERNVLDFWRAESDDPTPLIVFIHGGGFRSGSKENVYLPDLFQSLENNISFAAINYRFRETTRLDTIMYDCARAIQFLRSKANEWNIDKNKIAAYGGSAGGGASLWLGLTDDLANTDSKDPVLRESSRIQVIGHQNSQASYDFATWDEIIDLPENWMELYPNREDLDLYHIDTREQYSDPEIIELRKLLNMPAHLDEKDPPIYLRNMNSPDPPNTAAQIIHHPKHAIYLKSKFDEKNLDAYLLIQASPTENPKSVIEFFIEKFSGIETEMQDYRNNSIKIYPNPAREFIKIKSDESVQFIEIFNVKGERIYFAKNSENQAISVAKWPAGIYFIRTGTNQTAKIVIN
jgi:hypothetical protein